MANMDIIHRSSKSLQMTRNGVYCPLCLSICAPTFPLAMKHISRIHSFSSGFSITCGIQGCLRSYTNYSSWSKHVHNKHNIPSSTTMDLQNENQDFVEMEIDEMDEMESNTTELQSQNCKEREKARWILNLRDENKLTQSCTENILSNVTVLCLQLVDNIKQTIGKQLKECEVSSEIMDKVLQSLDSSDYKQPFKGLETKYQQVSFFKKNLGYVDPETHVFSTYMDWAVVHGVTKLTEMKDTYQYIPIIAVIQAMLHNRVLYEEIAHGHQRNDDIVEDFCDSKVAKNHPLFSQDSKALQILLYYDEIELCNPIGTSKTKHKIGCFYFTLGNINPILRSSTNAIQLTALAKTIHLSKYGINTILERIKSDISALEKGVNFITPEGEITLHGTLVTVSADNLGSHCIGGFKGSCTALRPCRHCMISYNEMRDKVSFDQCTMRTAEEHHQSCALLEMAPDSTFHSTTYGINFNSPLNNLQYYHVTNFGLPPDPMHDLLEGYTNRITKLILNTFINKKKYFSLATLNSAIKSCNYGKSTKPNCISDKELTSDSKLNQSASQMWTLSRLLPVMVGNYINEDDDNWLHFLQLLDIMEYTFSPTVLSHTPAYLTMIISSNLTTYKELYPEFSFIPKMHYMVHIPQYLFNIGPLVRHWTMRYEAKHQYFKQLSRVIGNYINICYTLAERHQLCQCYWLSSDETFKTKLEVGPGQALTNIPVDIQNLLRDSSSFFRAKWVKYNGNTLTKDYIVITNVIDEYEPEFAWINEITVSEQQHLILGITKCETICYNSHYHSWEIQKTLDKSVMLCTDFTTRQLLVPRHANINTHFVTLKYAAL